MHTIRKTDELVSGKERCFGECMAMMPCAARPNSGPCVGHKRHTGKEEMIALYGVRVSQWSMTYFAGAWISLALAEMVWMSGLAKPLSNIGSSWVLIGVHLTTLSFLTLLMIGALNQFVPVLTQTELASQRLSGITFVLTVIGVAGMIAGFLSLPATISGALFKSIPWLFANRRIVSGLRLGSGSYQSWDYREKGMAMGAANLVCLHGSLLFVGDHCGGTRVGFLPGLPGSFLFSPVTGDRRTGLSIACRGRNRRVVYSECHGCLIQIIGHVYSLAGA